MNWYVVYTKPKWEKKVAEELLQQGVECYCPLQTQIRQWSDRRKKVQVPLFNSYLFVRLEEADRNLVFHVSGVVRYLFWLGKPAIVRDEEINTIKKWLEAGDSYELTVDTLQAGDKLTLESGPFQSQEAIVKEVSKTHYVLLLESMGCVLKMKIK